eukprot:scaffold5539_cov81-Skeletonema_menzelii.AAC.14
MSCVTDGSHRDSLLLNSFLPSLPSQELVGSSEALEIEEVECNDGWLAVLPKERCTVSLLDVTW